MKRFWMLLALVICIPAHAAEESAQKVIDCMRANVSPTLQVQAIELESTDRDGGTRTLKGRLYVMREKSAARGNLLRVMLKVNAPSDLAGASYLVRESDDYLKDGMYVYLPSVRRVKRITGTFADGALMGTNFSYGDFKQLQSSFGDLDATLEKSEDVGDRPTNVLLFKGKPQAQDDKNPPLSARVWVDKKACVPLKIDFFQGQAVRKQLTVPADALKRSDKLWYLSEIHMLDLKDNTKTVLRVNELSSGKELPKRLFDATLFYEN